MSDQNSTSAVSEAVGLSHETFTLTLDKLIAGASPVIANAKCEFTYIWDWPRNMGLAHLTSINGNAVNIVLHPLGISGSLDFMSDIPPTEFVINGQRVIIYRVILDMPMGGEKSAAIMFNEDGSVIQASSGFQDGNLSKYDQ